MEGSELRVQPTPEMVACGIPVVGDDRLLRGEAKRRYHTIYAMVRMYGLSEGHTCGQCKYLHEVAYDNVYFKCKAFGREIGASTDWRKRWPACGYWVEREA